MANSSSCLPLRAARRKPQANKRGAGPSPHSNHRLGLHFGSSAITDEQMLTRTQRHP